MAHLLIDYPECALLSAKTINKGGLEKEIWKCGLKYISKPSFALTLGCDPCCCQTRVNNVLLSALTHPWELFLACQLMSHFGKFSLKYLWVFNAGTWLMPSNVVCLKLVYCQPFEGRLEQEANSASFIETLFTDIGHSQRILNAWLSFPLSPC